MTISTNRVTTSSGLSLAVHDAGPHDAPACVLVHGMAQSKQVWHRVLAGPLARELRLVALDLRGHGDSDKPERPEAYVRARLAEDLDAVISGLGLVRPTIAAWSFGGVVLGEYLRRHGDGALGGLVYVAGSVRTGRAARELFGPAMMSHASALLSEDPAIYAAGARSFVEACTVAPLAPAALDEAVAEMLRVPPHVRRPLLAGGEDYTAEIARTTVPIATLHGERDAVVGTAMSELIATLRPGVAEIRLPEVGHLPWLEAPAAFDAALRARVALAQ